LWKRLESYVLQHATACVFTTQRAAKSYGQRYPEASNKCVVIENGYDEEAFTGVTSDRFGAPDGTLLLLHSGLIYPDDRNPSTFFEAVRALIDEGKLDASRLCIRFRAAHHDDEVRAFATAYGLDRVVDIAPPLPYRKAIAEMMGADLLLVFQGSHFNAQIPAKIYEYLRSEGPVLGVLDLTGDTAEQLRQFEYVYLSDINNSTDIKNTILGWLNLATNTMSNAPANTNLELVRRYSRVAQAARLAEVLKSVTTV